MRQFIKDNGSLIEDNYSLPYNIADGNIPNDQGMEIDSFDAIYYRNPSVTWVTSKGVLDTDAEVGDIIWFYKAQTLDDNWLAANGTTFDATKYPKLYEILGSNTLPNLAGSEPVHLRGAGNNGSLPAPHTTLGLKETSGSNLGAHTHNISDTNHTHTVNSSHYHTTQIAASSTEAADTGSGHTTGYWSPDSNGTSFDQETDYKAPNVTIGSATPTITLGNPIQVSDGPLVNVNSNSSAGNIRAVWGMWYIRAK